MTNPAAFISGSGISIAIYCYLDLFACLIRSNSIGRLTIRCSASNGVNGLSAGRELAGLVIAPKSNSKRFSEIVNYTRRYLSRQGDGLLAS